MRYAQAFICGRPPGRPLEPPPQRRVAQRYHRHRPAACGGPTSSSAEPASPLAGPASPLGNPRDLCTRGAQYPREASFNTPRDLCNRGAQYSQGSIVQQLTCSEVSTSAPHLADPGVNARSRLCTFVEL